jgi:hypothetical protein
MYATKAHVCPCQHTLQLWPTPLDVALQAHEPSDVQGVRRAIQTLQAAKERRERVSEKELSG